jgi:hypothetical protein
VLEIKRGRSIMKHIVGTDISRRAALHGTLAFGAHGAAPQAAIGDAASRCAGRAAAWWRSRRRLQADRLRRRLDLKERRMEPFFNPKAARVLHQGRLRAVCRQRCSCSSPTTSDHMGAVSKC